MLGSLNDVMEEEKAASIDNEYGCKRFVFWERRGKMLFVKDVFLYYVSDSRRGHCF